MPEAPNPFANGVPCSACGAVIEGACIVEHPRAFHAYCWHTRERAESHPGLDAIARDLAQSEQAEG